MKWNALFLTCALLTVACATHTSRSPQKTGEGPLRVAAEDLDWEEVAAVPGEHLVVLAGDPNAAGEYTLRRRFPPGHKTLPHWHPHAEYGTVLAGVLYVGFGNEFRQDETVAVRAGGFIRLPPFTPHYTYADEPVVLQVHGPGPRETHYVHDRPVPRRR